MAGNPSFTKRQKERQRKEKQQDKAAKKAERKREKALRPEGSSDDDMMVGLVEGEAPAAPPGFEPSPANGAGQPTRATVPRSTK